MINKILKYDLKSLYKVLIPDYIILIIIAILTKVFGILKDTTSIFSIPYSMILFLFIIALIVAFVHTFFVAIIRFYKNMLRDESYLTHTLPVEKKSLVISKLISSFITMLTSIVVLISSVLIAFYSKGIVSNLISGLNEFVKLSGVTDLNMFYTYMIMAILIGYLSYITVFYLALVLGHSKDSNKMKYSFVYGIIIYVIQQMIAVLFIASAYLMSDGFREAFKEDTNASLTTIIPCLFIYMIVQVIVIIVENYITISKLKNNLNIE